MVDGICDFLTNKIKKEMPEVDEQRAEVIKYGLQLIIGEIPKTFILLAIAYLLGVLKLAVIAFLITLPYKTVSGGIHLKTHIGCIIGTSIIYCGNVFISKYVLLEPMFIKYLTVFLVWVFGMIMIKLYAPADTENIPILRKKERIVKQILSYIILTSSLIISIFIKDNIISNIIIFGMLIQSITITKFAYKMTKNKYGYEVYNSNLT